MARAHRGGPKSSPQTKRDLSDITICAADCIHVPLAAQALERSIDQCQFGDAILFSDKAIPGRFRHVAVNTFRSREDYSAFVTRELIHVIQTKFVLIVQWDGYVVDQNAWSDDFQTYDYIGARWLDHTDGMTVRNGGFSLRSRKFLEALIAENLFCPPEETEDEFICRTHRRTLERKHGIRFAPDHVADRFAYERAPPLQPSFGFHGLFNLPRHISVPEMVAVVGSMGRGTIRTSDFVEIMITQLSLDQTRVARAMYLRWCGEVPAHERQNQLQAWLHEPEQVAFVTECFDRLIARSSAARSLRG